MTGRFFLKSSTLFFLKKVRTTGTFLWLSAYHGSVSFDLLDKVYTRGISVHLFKKWNKLEMTPQGHQRIRTFPAASQQGKGFFTSPASAAPLQGLSDPDVCGALWVWGIPGTGDGVHRVLTHGHILKPLQAIVFEREGLALTYLRQIANMHEGPDAGSFWFFVWFKSLDSFASLAWRTWTLPSTEDPV